MAAPTAIFSDRAVLGTTAALGAPFASPLRVVGIPARAAGSPLIGIDAAGDLRSGALVASEIPSVFTRRDVAEIIGASWTWAAGQTITFEAGGSVAPPQATSRSIGTRILIEPVPGATEYAIGRETAALWTSVPSGGEHRWYQSSVCRLRLASDGALNVENGSGYVTLNGPSGVGTVYAPGALGLIGGSTGSGYISINTGGGLIVPVYNYRENLGNLQRKFLSLHAAELWVETLVAQSTLATIGGRILVGPTTTLTRDITSSQTTIHVKHNSLKLHVGGVEYGSKLLLEVAGRVEVMAITSTTTPAATAQGDYPYTVIRAFGGGAWDWYAGDACFDTGKLAAPSGAFIDLYSVQGVNAGSSAGPTIVGNIRTGANAFDWRERWAVGNLRGIYSNGAADVMGAAFGDPLGMHLQVDATEGIRMLGASNTYVYGHWRINGDLILGYPNSSALSFIASEGSLNLQVNGVYKMRLLNDGSMYLTTALIAGTGTTSGIVRSYLATAWNSGTGYYFYGDPSGALCLIGNSAGRRIQWDNNDLRIVSDGFTLDQNGIVFTAGAYAPSRRIQFGSGPATVLWDSGTEFYVSRNAGAVLIEQLSANGYVALISGGAGIDRVLLTLQAQSGVPAQLVLQATGATGGYPRFVPGHNNLCDLGRTDLPWRNLYLGNAVYTAAVVCSSWISIGNPGTAGSYQLALSADSAAKPVSSTWAVASGRATKTEIAPVDHRDALDRVRRVDLVRFRTIEGGLPGIGVIADDVRDALPLSVKESEAGALYFNAHELFMLNVAAVQALAARLDALEGKGSV